MSETLPDLPDLCWPVDWSCVPNGGDSIDPTVRAQAEALAVSTLRALTGFQVGGCSVTVRPCALRCQPDPYLIAPVGSANGWMNPHLNSSGSWVNSCGCSTDCSCGMLSEVLLPGPVGRVDLVLVDDLVLDPGDYRIDNGNRLVRLDGLLWPVCQDMAAAPGDDNTFAVTYLRGVAPDANAAYVAGLLAYEYAKACQGQDCALPRTATSVVRPGLTMVLDQNAFKEGLTGIFPVDSWLRAINPYKIKSVAEVFSPDVRPTRTTTWSD